MKTKLLSKNLKQQKAYLSISLFLISLFTYSQEPLPTSNTLINGVTVYSFFDEQVDLTVDPPKENYAINLVDDNPDTDWAAQSTTGEELILNLGGAYDLAEIQHLTVLKQFPYEFQIWVSTDTDPDADVYVNAFPSAGNLQSHFGPSGTEIIYKSFDLGVITGATYVKIKCYGRVGEGSAWNTISELKFYSSPTASVEDNELSGFSLYPNPANNSFTLSDLSHKVNNLQIISLEGKVISSKSIESFENNLTIDTSFLANGVYLVKLSDTTSNLNTAKMIVIQH